MEKAVHPVKIFSEGFALWKSKFWVLVSIAAVFGLPQLLANQLGPLFAPMAASSKQLISFLLYIILTLIHIWGMAALILAAKEKTNFSDSIRQSRKYIWPYLGGSILYLLLLGAFFLIVAAATAVASFIFLRANALTGITVASVVIIAAVGTSVYFAIRLSLFGIACVAEDKSALSALKRSFALVKNYVTGYVGLGILVIGFTLLCFFPLMLFAGWGAATAQGATPVVLYGYLANLLLMSLSVCIYLVCFRKLTEIADRI